MNLTSTFIFLLIQFYVCYASTTDPCGNYTAINDTTMTVAHKASSSKDLTCQNLPPLKWYRYTGTTKGLMARACPQDLQCGSLNQIWFNDTLPTLSDGEIEKQICVHQGLKCCAIKNNIKTKNCTGFIIYRLMPSSQPCTNYCYEAPAVDKSTSNPDNSSTHNNSQSTASFLTIWMLVVAVVVAM